MRRPARLRAWTAILRMLLLVLFLSPLLLLPPAPLAVGGETAAPVALDPPANCSAAAGTCVRIGYFACPWSGPACSSFLGHAEMVEWYRERVATQLGGKLGGASVRWVRATVTSLIHGSARDLYDTTDRLFIGDAARNGTGPPLVDFVILPFGSQWDTAMQLMERHRIPSVSASSPDSKLFQCGPTADVWNVTQPGCSGPNTRRYKYAHGISAPGEQYFQPWIGLLKLHKARSIALVRTVSSFYQTVRAGAITAARDNSIPIVYDEMVRLNTTAIPAVLEPATVSRVVAEVEALQPDAFLLITENCVPWILEMERRDYTPKSLAAVLCSDGAGPLARLGDRLRYVVGSAQWSPEQHGSDSQENVELQPWSLFPHVPGGLSSPLLFQQLFRRLVNSSVVPGYGEATVLAAFTFLEGAITLAGTVDPESVQAQLLTYYQPSFYGLITTNRFGQNEQKRLIINQRDETNKLQIISPSSMGTHDFIYPMPRFSERVYRAQIMTSTVERVLLGLIAFCVALTGTLALLVYWDRRNQTFQSTSVPFYLLTALGCICAYASIPTWPVENDSNSCASRVWTWTLSFHLFVDPILAVAFHMARAVADDPSPRAKQSPRQNSATTRQLAAGCTLLVAPQLLLNALWSALEPLRPEVVTADPLRPAFTSFTTCSSGGGSGSTVLLVLTLSYCGVLLLSLCLLMQRVRRVRGPRSEAPALASAAYLFSMTAAVVLLVQLALSHDELSSERVLFGLRSVGLLVAYQGSTLLLFLPRVAKLLPRLADGWHCGGCSGWKLRGTCVTVTTESPQPSSRAGQATAHARAWPSPQPSAPHRSIRLSASSAVAPLSERAEARAGGSGSAVAPLLAADLFGARVPLPPRRQLLSLPLEETITVVAHYHALIQQLIVAENSTGGDGKLADAVGAAGTTAGTPVDGSPAAPAVPAPDTMPAAAGAAAVGAAEADTAVVSFVPLQSSALVSPSDPPLVSSPAAPTPNL